MTNLKIHVETGLKHPTLQQQTIGWLQVTLFLAVLLGSFPLGLAQSAAAQSATVEPVTAPVVVRTTQGQTLYCHPTGMGPSLNCNLQSTPPAASQSTPTQPAPTQSLDGAPDMLLKLLYLGLPVAILMVISLRSLHQHRETLKKRAFLESLERIWERSAQY
jgi:hypothetical protein